MGEPWLRTSSGAAAMPRSNGLGIILVLALALAGLSQCFSSTTIHKVSADQRKALTGDQLGECRNGLREAGRLGLIRARGPGVVFVDEAAWAGLSRDHKKVYMICAVADERWGSLDDDIRAIGYRSKAVLAEGSPGQRRWSMPQGN